MKVKLTSLSLGLAVLAATGSPALAGGDAYEGIKDYSHSTPVPAPIPVGINEAQWYLRGDLGYAFAQGGTVDQTGGYPVKTFDFEGSDQTFSVGIGIGYYLMRNVRLEVAGDWNNKTTASHFNDNVFDAEVTVRRNGYTDRYEYSGSFDHKTEFESSAALINAFYDFNTGSRFRPYIGAGIGLSVNRLRVTGETNVTCDDGYRGNIDLGCAGAEYVNGIDSNTVTAYGVAAAAMVGAAWEISDGIHWDTGYRFIYRGGTADIDFHTPEGEGNIRIEDRIDHEIRTGIRFDIE